MSPPINEVVTGDARSVLRTFPPACIDAVITSPPYFRLRDYGVARQIGLEPSIDEWVDELRLVFRGIARVLSPYGSVWLNLGDSFSRKSEHGAPAKSLLLGPERLACALLKESYSIRNKVVWAKSRPMPTSARDRLACTWEVMYLLTRSKEYYFDLDAIRVPHRSGRFTPRSTAETYPPPGVSPGRSHGARPGNGGLAALKRMGLPGHPLGKNPGDVWTLPSAHFQGAHFATFPEALIERPTVASVPEKVCRTCSVPWRRETKLERVRPRCRCRPNARTGLVLDPFMGSGTVALVARRLGRNFVGIELNPRFASLARSRVRREGGT